MSFPGWRELLPEYLTRLDAGTGAFQAQATGRGARLRARRARIQREGVVTKLTDGANTMIEQVSGALSLVHSARSLDARRAAPARRSRGTPRPEVEFDASWREKRAGMLDLHAEANYLRAEALLPLLGLMPQKDIRDRLRDAAPTGEWTDMRLTLSRAAGERALAFRCAREIPRRGIRAGRTRARACAA